MKKPSLELVLSTLGVIGILIVGLLTVNCAGGSAPPPCLPRVISGDFETETSLITTADIAPGEIFEKTIEIDLFDEFTKRYSVNLDSVRAFNVTIAAASFTSDRCADLSFYDATIAFPQIGTVNEMNRCSFPEFQNIPDPTRTGNRFIFFSEAFPGTNPTAISALATNFADDFKMKKKIIVTVRFGAANAIPAGFGVVLYLKSKMLYGVCE